MAEREFLADESLPFFPFKSEIASRLRVSQAAPGSVKFFNFYGEEA